VRASHFTRLLAQKDVPTLMQAGLDALYTRHDPAAAAVRFREVLARDPEHYGATVQLAKALDASGIGAEAAQWWTRVLTLAQEAGDSVTAATARKRLQQ
jgi:Tfp pilus assembly protein PilF